MMNGGHAASGALTGTAAVCLLQTLGWAPVSTATYLWGAIGLGAASALLPDIDCDGSAMYRSVPPLTPALGEMVQLKEKYDPHNVMGLTGGWKVPG